MRRSARLPAHLSLLLLVDPGAHRATESSELGGLSGHPGLPFSLDIFSPHTTQSENSPPFIPKHPFIPPLLYATSTASKVLVVIAVQSGLGGSRGFPLAIISEARQGRGNVRQPSSANPAPRTTVALIDWGRRLVLVRTSEEAHLQETVRSSFQSVV